MEEKNPDHPDKEEAARMVALGAIRFSMVKTEPKKQIDFRYQEALSFEGDTGPYVQYAHARAHSILRKAGEWGAPDLSQATPYERALALDLLDFEEAVLEAAEEKTPTSSPSTSWTSRRAGTPTTTPGKTASPPPPSSPPLRG